MQNEDDLRGLAKVMDFNPTFLHRKSQTSQRALTP